MVENMIKHHYNIPSFTLVGNMNKTQIVRLTKYMRTLLKLKALGMTKVFSSNLSDPIGEKAHIVRKDFSLLGITGNKRGGFEVDDLIEKISAILGKNKSQNAILIGLGRIGAALLNYDGFKKEGISIIAGFDKDPNRIMLPTSIPLYSMATIEDFLKANPVEVAILAIPEMEALSTFNKLKDLGVRGFLNFSPTELKCISTCDKDLCPRPCIVNNVNIGLELEQIFYQLNIAHAKE